MFWTFKFDLKPSARGLAPGKHYLFMIYRGLTYRNEKFLVDLDLKI